jgi:hypothetical protein
LYNSHGTKVSNKVTDFSARHRSLAFKYAGWLSQITLKQQLGDANEERARAKMNNGAARNELERTPGEE